MTFEEYWAEFTQRWPAQPTINRSAFYMHAKMGWTAAQQVHNIVAHLQSVDAPTFGQVITDLAKDNILRARMKKALGVPE